jgi:hypothetical protein
MNTWAGGGALCAEFIRTGATTAALGGDWGGGEASASGWAHRFLTAASAAPRTFGGGTVGGTGAC